MARITSLAVVRADTHKIVEINSALTRNQLIDKCRRHNDRNLTKVAIAKVAYDLEVGPAFGQRKITNLTVVSVLEYSL
jgi:hypothetical protein